MTAELKPMTLEEFARYEDDPRYELVDGRLERRKMSNRSSRIGGMIYSLFLEFSKKQRVGEPHPDNVTYRCFPTDPNRVRKPDVSWFTAARWNPDLLNTTHIEAAPDLVVEVVSPKENANKVTKKIQQFIRAGTKEAWIVWPESQELERRFADGTARWYGADEEIDAAPLLPGLIWKLADVLARA